MLFRSWSIHWFWAALGLLIVLGAIGLVCRPGLVSCLLRVTGWSSAVPPPRPLYSSAPTVEKLQPLAELVSLRVQVVDILTVEQAGWLHGYQGAWLIHGHALWTTDLAQARLQEVHPFSGPSTIRIELPRPRVEWARLDHTRTRTYDLRSKSWIPLMRVLDQVRDEALQRAQQLVERTANQEKYRRQAERQAAETLTKFYAGYGFSTEVVWVEATPATVTEPHD